MASSSLPSEPSCSREHAASTHLLSYGDVRILDQRLEAPCLLEGGNLVDFPKGAEDHVEGVQGDQAVRLQQGGIWCQAASAF